MAIKPKRSRSGSQVKQPPIELIMRGLYLKCVAIYFFFAFAKGTIADFKPSIACSVCYGYHICGFRGYDLPDCLNGHPCTREQYRLCVKMINRNPNGKCDRLGIFPDPNNRNNFYQCVIKENTSKMVKLSWTCPSRTSFDASTVRCLTKEEKNMLQAAEELDVRMKSTEETFQCQNFGIFSDPHDCKKYHVCDSKLQSRDFYCPVGTYFSNDTCGATKTDQCIKQLLRQSNNQIEEAHSRYKRLKYALSKNFSGGNSLRNSQDRVIKRGFDGLPGMSYRIYGVGEKSQAETSIDMPETVSNIEKVIENLITKYTANEHDTNDLSKLQADIQNETINVLNNTRIIKLNLNVKPCEADKNKSFPMEENQNLVSVLIVVITTVTTEGTKVIEFSSKNAKANAPQKGLTTEKGMTTNDENILKTTETLVTSQDTEYTQKPLMYTKYVDQTEEFLGNPTEWIPVSDENTLFSSHAEATTSAEDFTDNPILMETITSAGNNFAETDSTKSHSSPFSEELTSSTYPGTTIGTDSANLAATSPSDELTTSTDTTTTSYQKTQTSEEILGDTVDRETTIIQIISTTLTPKLLSEELTSSTHSDTTVGTTSAILMATPSSEDLTSSTDKTNQSFATIPQKTQTSEEVLGDTADEKTTFTTSRSTPSSTNIGISNEPNISQAVQPVMPLTHAKTPISGGKVPTSVNTDKPFALLNKKGNKSTGQSSTTFETQSINKVLEIPSFNRTIFNISWEVVHAPKNPSIYAAVLTTTESPMSAAWKSKRFRCPYVGYFRDPDDCHSFYRCKRVTVSRQKVSRWKLVASHHTCKKGRWFSKFFWKCIKSKPLGC